MFITYKDVTNLKTVVKSEFKSKIELRNTILKSCHLPKFTNKDFFFKNNNKLFFDGGFPHIFKNRTLNDNKILYISLSHYSMIKNMFSSKNEENVYGRILEGILDTYKFFTYQKNTIMCSYVNNWTLNDYLILHTKELIYKLLFYTILIFYKINKQLFPYFKNNTIINDFSLIIQKFLQNIILLYCI